MNKVREGFWAGLILGVLAGVVIAALALTLSSCASDNNAVEADDQAKNISADSWDCDANTRCPPLLRDVKTFITYDGIVCTKQGPHEWGVDTNFIVHCERPSPPLAVEFHLIPIPPNPSDNCILNDGTIGPCKLVPGGPIDVTPLNPGDIPGYSNIAPNVCLQSNGLWTECKGN